MRKRFVGSAASHRGRALAWVSRAAAMVMLAILVAPARADDRPVKSRVPPVYPEMAKRLKISGEVVVRATVGADGKVSDVKAVTGHHMLTSAAEDAVRRWRFEPGEGSTTVDVQVNFAAAAQ